MTFRAHFVAKDKADIQFNFRISIRKKIFKTHNLVVPLYLIKFRPYIFIYQKIQKIPKCIYVNYNKYKSVN